jgi:predicted metal-dependent hydrolase
MTRSAASNRSGKTTSATRARSATNLEWSAIRWGRIRIPFAIRRSPHRQGSSLAVYPRAGVLLTTPLGTTTTWANQVIRESAIWIIERLRAVSPNPPPKPTKVFVDGEPFMLLGVEYRLQPRQSLAARYRVRTEGDSLVVELNRQFDKTTEPFRARALLIEWYKQHAAEKLQERVAEWAAKIGVPVPQVVVSDQRTRWVSCITPGVIRFNWRIIQAPLLVVDYAVAHELVHLFHVDHTGAFWERLEGAMPDCEARRVRFREMEKGMEW